MATVLYLIRHGHLPTEYNHRYVGSLNPGLSDEGKAQCAYLRKVSCDCTFSSPSRRALETAAFLPSPLRVDARLCEIDFGDWENLTYDEIAERANPEILQRWTNEPERMVFPGGESVTTFQKRIDEVFAEICQMPISRIAVVTHGGCLMRILSQLRKLPMIRQWEALPPRGTMVELVNTKGQWHEK